MSEEKMGAAADFIEVAAQELSDYNMVEQAWFLRGVGDALLNEIDRSVWGDESYGQHYRAGYRAVVAWENDAL